jgi:hypothetical protein
MFNLKDIYYYYRIKSALKEVEEYLRLFFFSFKKSKIKEVFVHLAEIFIHLKSFYCFNEMEAFKVFLFIINIIILNE